MRASLSARLIASASVSLSVLDADDIDLSVFSGTVSGIEVARRDDGGPTSALNETSTSDLAGEGRLPGGRLSSGTVSGIEVARRDDGGPSSVLNETSASDLTGEGRLPGGRLLTS